MYDVYVYATINDYMARYKPYLNDPAYHIEIDAFYINDKQIIFALLDDKLTVRRPHLDSAMVLIEHKDISTHFNHLDYDKVTYRDVLYLPKINGLGFIKQGLFRKSYKFYLKCSRVLGTKPTACSIVGYNWFFDSVNKRLNFVLSSS